MILEELHKLGYDNVFQKSKYTMHVLVNDKNRVSELQKIAHNLNGVYDSTPTSSSSVGKVKVDKYTIFVKPMNKQGDDSYGRQNEQFFVEMLNKYADKIDFIVFNALNATKTISYTKHEDVSKTKTKIRNKADVKIIGKVDVNLISIKQENAQIWESADTYAKTLVKLYVQKMLMDNLVTLEFENGVYKIFPNIAIECTDDEAKDVVFGDDILNNGFICIKNFEESDFVLEKNILFIRCDQIVFNMKDLKDYQKPFFLIRNDSTRNCAYKGLRILACYASRINKNVHTIHMKDRIDFPGLT